MNIFSLSFSDRRFARFRVRRAPIALLLATIVAGAGWAQTATTLSPLVTYPIVDPLIYAGSAGMVLLSYPLEAHKPKPDLSKLSVADIPSFDRLFYRTHRSEPLSLASDATLAATALLPLVIAPSLSRNELLTSGVVYSEALGLSYGLKSILKGLVVRYRPYAYAATKSNALLTDPEIEDSFPSGHVTVAFAAAVSTGYIFDLYNSNLGERVAVWSTALGLATATAIFRVWSGNHFLSDVLAAAAVGAIVGVAVPFVHSPTSLSAVGITPPVKSLLPPGGIPFFRYSLRLP